MLFLSTSGRNDELVKEKKEIRADINKIEFVDKNRIDIRKKVITLPYIEGHGYYAFRLMIDNEVDDPASWARFDECDGELMELACGDQIII